MGAGGQGAAPRRSLCPWEWKAETVGSPSKAVAFATTLAPLRFFQMSAPVPGILETETAMASRFG